MREEVRKWWKQSEADRKSARDSIESGNYYLVAFLCHQTVEKALKALYIHEHSESPNTHNLVRLARELDASDELVASCAELNQDYVNARYPDAAPGVPAETYPERIAAERLEHMEEVVAWIKTQLPL